VVANTSRLIPLREIPLTRGTWGKKRNENKMNLLAAMTV
jgi:hypothetical protein